jgi:hypothetical protein
MRLETLGRRTTNAEMAAIWQAFRSVCYPLLAACCPMRSIPGIDPEASAVTVGFPAMSLAGGQRTGCVHLMVQPSQWQ